MKKQADVLHMAVGHEKMSIVVCFKTLEIASKSDKKFGNMNFTVEKRSINFDKINVYLCLLVPATGIQSEWVEPTPPVEALQNRRSCASSLETFTKSECAASGFPGLR